MVGKFISTALIGMCVFGSFYFFGEVQADPKASIALFGPVTGETTAAN